MPASFQLRRDKRDLERSTLESLTKILTPEQYEKLPPLEGRDRSLLGRDRDGEGGQRQQRPERGA
jgi:hypothetical protein